MSDERSVVVKDVLRAHVDECALIHVDVRGARRVQVVRADGTVRVTDSSEVLQALLAREQIESETLGAPKKRVVVCKLCSAPFALKKGDVPGHTATCPTCRRPPCADCGKPVSVGRGRNRPKSTESRCRPCKRVRAQSYPDTCSQCPSKILRTTGREAVRHGRAPLCKACSIENLRSCANSPKAKEAVKAALKASAEDPGKRAAMVKRAKALNARRTTEDRQRAAAKISRAKIDARNEKIRAAKRGRP